MVTIPTKFQLHTKLYTNMTSDDPWMTSDDLENTVKNFRQIVNVPTKSHDDHTTFNTIWYPKKYKKYAN